MDAVWPVGLVQLLTLFVVESFDADIFTLYTVLEVFISNSLERLLETLVLSATYHTLVFFKNIVCFFLLPPQMGKTLLQTLRWKRLLNCSLFLKVLFICRDVCWFWVSHWLPIFKRAQAWELDWRFIHCRIIHINPVCIGILLTLLRRLLVCYVLIQAKFSTRSDFFNSLEWSSFCEEDIFTNAFGHLFASTVATTDEEMLIVHFFGHDCLLSN